MTRNEIQQKAVEEWLKHNKHGTLALATGTGKTIAALHCLYTMPQKDGKVHLFLAETVEREKDLLSDIELFNTLFKVNVSSLFEFGFEEEIVPKISLVTNLPFACNSLYFILFVSNFNSISSVTGLISTIMLAVVVLDKLEFVLSA